MTRWVARTPSRRHSAPSTTAAHKRPVAIRATGHIEGVSHEPPRDTDRHLRLPGDRHLHGGVTMTAIEELIAAFAALADDLDARLDAMLEDVA